MESYEQMILDKAGYEAYCIALNQVGLNIIRIVEKANQTLDGRINDLRHLMNDQLIELKYGKGYKAIFLDEILLKAQNI